MKAAFGTLNEHLDQLGDGLQSLAKQNDVLDRWARELAVAFAAGNHLLAAGNGGSAAEAQHLTAELVGRFESGRAALPAIALHADSSTMTAIGNDFGQERVFARQVEAHGRPGDVLILLSTSGASPNLLAAADAGRLLGLHVWAMTGPRPNPLAELADDVLAIESIAPTAVQEAHLIAIHALCAGLERVMLPGPEAGR